MTHLRFRQVAMATIALGVAAVSAALAAGGAVDPHPPITNWITDPVTPIAHAVREEAIFSTILIAPFFFGPIAALLYCIWRFDAKRNPKPATFHENLPLEVAWTVIPAFVLVAVAMSAYPVLVLMDKPPKSDIVVNVQGQQFFWTYEFPKYDVTVTDDGSGNSPLIVPVGKYVTMNGTATQVNHAWWVPAFAIKYDVIPGRISHSWFKVEREGFYKGQCAELCGTGHAAMLIHVKVVSEEEFRQWVLSKNPAAKFDDEPTAVSDSGSDAMKGTYARVALEPANKEVVH